MYGAYIGRLYVYLSTNGANQTIWEKSGEQGDSWMEAFLNLPAKPHTTYQVRYPTLSMRLASVKRELQVTF